MGYWGSGWGSVGGFLKDPLQLDLLGEHAGAEAAQQQFDAQQEAREFARDETGRMREYLAGQQDVAGGYIGQGYNQGIGALSSAYRDAGASMGAGMGELRSGTSGALAEMRRGYGQARTDLAGVDASATRGIMARGDELSARMDRPVDLAADPGYQFRREQGEQAINRAASAAGGRSGGRTLKALADYNSDLASQEYGAAFARKQASDAAQAGLLGQQYGAAGMLDQTEMQRQSALSGLAYGQGQGAANIGMQGAGSLANMYGQQANMYGQYGGQLGQMYAGQGSDLGGNALATSALNTQLATGLIGSEQNFAQYGGMVAQQQANQKGQTVGLVGSVIGALSDRRAKDNIEPAPFAVDRMLDEIYPYTYTYKDAGNGAGVHLGVMAQDLERSEVGAWMVNDTPDGKKVDLSRAVMALLGVVAHLHRRIDGLEVAARKVA